MFNSILNMSLELLTNFTKGSILMFGCFLDVPLTCLKKDKTLNTLTSGICDNTCIRIWLASFCSFDSCTILENSVCYVWFLVLEAVAQMCSVKKVFLKILHNSQEHSCVRVCFLIKLQAWGQQLYWKKTVAQVFSCECWKISKNTLFTEHFWWILLWFILYPFIVATWAS